jgi:hypothetical protein
LKYTFSKEIIPRKFVDGQGWIYNIRVYKVFDADKLIGTFEYHYTRHIITFQDREFVIEVFEPYFKKPSFKLVDKHTNELIGEFKFYIWRKNTFRFDKPLIGQNEFFIFEKIRTGIPVSIFKKSSWGHLKFQLTNGTAAAVYSLKTEHSWFRPSMQTRPSRGEVELWGDNLLIVFAGFFMIERHFKIEDSTSS